MQEIAYIDLHCDTLTESCKRGETINDCALQVNLKKLKESRCAAQCFALFTQGQSAAADYEKYIAAWDKQINSGGISVIENYADLARCLEKGETGAILTIENLGFTGKDLSRLYELKRKGVKMASLVWNYENELAYPNIIFEDGAPRFDLRESRYLKKLGARAVEILDELKIIADISHLSDGGAKEILSGRKIPVVASHSNAAAVCNVSRNLTDELIKGIADCGGVIGLNFCYDFIGNSNIFGGLLQHFRHLIDVGGEDIVALGSDFDGIPAYPELCDCTRVQSLFEFFEKGGVSRRVLEKLAYKNFARVFKEVCG